MTKIREIIEKYQSMAVGVDKEKETEIWSADTRIYEFNFDSLEKELQSLMTKAVNKAYLNARRSLNKTNERKENEKQTQRKTK